MYEDGGQGGSAMAMYKHGIAAVGASDIARSFLSSTNGLSVKFFTSKVDGIFQYGASTVNGEGLRASRGGVSVSVTTGYG